jgi:hypothetical protein
MSDVHHSLAYYKHMKLAGLLQYRPCFAETSTPKFNAMQLNPLLLFARASFFSFPSYRAGQMMGRFTYA